MQNWWTLHFRLAKLVDPPWCSPCQWHGINSVVHFRSRISARRYVYFRQKTCRLGRYSLRLWISAAEFPPDDDNPKLSHLDRQKFLPWISATEYSPDDMFLSARWYVDWADSCCGFPPQNFSQTMPTQNGHGAAFMTPPPFHIACFCGSASGVWHVPLGNGYHIMFGKACWPM